MPTAEPSTTQWLQVDSVASTGVCSTVYNIRVVDWHTYFVGGANWGFAVWVHNSYTSKSAASRFGDRSWKNLIEGQAHGTNAHKIRTYREAIRMAKSGQYKRVYINKALSTASGKQVNSLLRPDVTGVRPGGLMDMIEVPHPRQTEALMWDKMWGMEELLGDLAGRGNVVPIR